MPETLTARIQRAQMRVRKLGVGECALIEGLERALVRELVIDLRLAEQRFEGALRARRGGSWADRRFRVGARAGGIVPVVRTR